MIKLKDILIEETIFSLIYKKDKQATEKRLKKLKAINAPKVIISNLEKQLQDYKQVVNKIKSIDKFGKLKVKTYKIKKGRGGKLFFEIVTQNGIIYYFPEGKFGPFLKMK